MKKIINSKETLIEDMLTGFIKAEGSKVLQSKENTRVLYRRKMLRGKVGIVTGGGSGHEPLFFGMVGENLVDAVAVGNIFTAPTPDTVLGAIKKADQGKGVICLFGNYAGDVLNFDMGAELAEYEGIEVRNLSITDDVASADKAHKTERRGIAGNLLVIKETAAAAAKGYSLNDCHEVGKKANERTFSIGVGIQPGTNPLNGKKNFDLKEDEIEFGLGIHGEPGLAKMKLIPAKDLVAKMYICLSKELMEYSEKNVIVYINGLGATTMLELYTITKEIHQLLEGKGYCVHDTVVGNICTTQEMAGFSITIQVLDEELEELYQVEAYSSCYYQKGEL